jgi:hypothetical protein
MRSGRNREAGGEPGSRVAELTQAETAGIHGGAELLTPLIVVRVDDDHLHRPGGEGSTHRNESRPVSTRHRTASRPVDEDQSGGGLAARESHELIEGHGVPGELVECESRHLSAQGHGGRGGRLLRGRQAGEGENENSSKNSSTGEGAQSGSPALRSRGAAMPEAVPAVD